jgi:hypothetical protein
MMRKSWFWIAMAKMLAVALMMVVATMLPLPWCFLALPLGVWFWRITQHPEWWVKLHR